MWGVRVEAEGGKWRTRKKPVACPSPIRPPSSLAVRHRRWFFRATFIPFPITMKTTKTRYPPNTPLHVSARNIGEEVEVEEVEAKSWGLKGAGIILVFPSLGFKRSFSSWMRRSGPGRRGGEVGGLGRGDLARDSAGINSDL